MITTKTAHCLGCGKPIDVGAGHRLRCPMCARARNRLLMRTRYAGVRAEYQRKLRACGVPVRHKREAEALAIWATDEEMIANFMTYGVHPKCSACPERCKTYSAPHSRIVYCPGMEQSQSQESPTP